MVMPKKEKAGSLCEQTKKAEYESKGYLVVPTGKGHDFVAIRPNKRPIFVEVKQGCGSLTKFQEKTRDEVTRDGSEYKIERCSCSTNEEHEKSS
jgi:hypothetical protein